MTELICITCPKGCHLQVSLENGTYKVSGNTCKRGEIYGINEVTNPIRMITSTVVVLNGDLDRLPVVTDKPIPKAKIFDVMNEINKVKVNAPINIKDVVIENVLGLGVNIVASRNVSLK